MLSLPAMPNREPLSDDAAYERLANALNALGNEPGATVRADTAIKAARRSLNLLMFGLLAAQAAGSDEVPGIKAPAASSDPA
ncbi:hypothetical protein U0C82_03725 [Fulvimarina sp. 2208YS6-2-32]|uniref:Uncharacterized protein n=1 Tax=Fulvimarina uroteuthidis TaxID=3098149 RepID=A0ABU5HZV0_9HYPH|nr:hypothetical protein [Fulvimarina sp. 2208YS6-2-32]MDY8108258.1 hypothetical protein [Fulvimarina sp. 2208YS6-2-32]